MIPVSSRSAATAGLVSRLCALPSGGLACGLLAVCGVALATPAAAQYARYPDAYGTVPPRYVPLPRAAALPAEEIRNIVFRMGYRQISQPVMQGRSYVLAARDEYGLAVLRVDAFTGRVTSAQPLRGRATIAVPGAEPPPPARAAPQRAPASRGPSTALRAVAPPRSEAPAAAPAEAPLPPKRPEFAAAPATAAPAPAMPPVTAPAAAPAPEHASPAAAESAPAPEARPVAAAKPDVAKPDAAKPVSARPAAGAGTATGAASAGSASVLSRPKPKAE